MAAQPSKTFKLTISKTATFEEMQNAIRKMVDPDFELNPDAYALFIAQNEEDIIYHTKAIEALGPYYDLYIDKTDRESEKRKMELQDLAYYMLFSLDKIELVEVLESPDFILNINGERTGVEHTSIHDESIIKDVKYLEKLCKGAQQELIDNKVVSKKLYDIQFDDAQPYNGNLKDHVRDLVNYFEARFKNEKPVKPAYIREVNISPIDGIQLRLSEVYEVKPVSTEYIDKLIRKKEAKLAEYRKNSKTDRQWLLIIQEGSSAESTFDITPDMLPKRVFEFDKITVFDTFKSVAIATLRNSE